ncbi:unnamed protein product [Nesidiocoris tenuis]|uniref:Uncharacterized protein n=1 Tax=Nesidiocoris tenuis TaxID=355587 RepID=A0A6H5H4D9_9HEMI|nr:unnamed protein product [Nesidiocoris tenuis]
MSCFLRKCVLKLFILSCRSCGRSWKPYNRHLFRRLLDDVSGNASALYYLNISWDSSLGISAEKVLNTVFLLELLEIDTESRKKGMPHRDRPASARHRNFASMYSGRESDIAHNVFNFVGLYEQYGRAPGSTVTPKLRSSEEQKHIDALQSLSARLASVLRPAVGEGRGGDRSPEEAKARTRRLILDTSRGGSQLGNRIKHDAEARGIIMLIIMIRTFGVQKPYRHPIMGSSPPTTIRTESAELTWSQRMRITGIMDLPVD